MERRILVVDDSELICQQLSQLLALPDRQIALATDGTAALEWLVEHPCSLVLTDLRLPGISGLDLIKEIRKKDLPVTVIVMTGFATVEDTVEAIKLGAYDLVQKPLDTVSLEVLVNHALEDRRLIDEVADLRCRLQRKSAYHNLLGQSPGMTEVFERVARVGSSSCTVLITGETGTGKELVAQAIHFSDVTRSGPLVAVNCAALPEHLLESELFGHERGAFTGADRQKKGRFDLAQGGTLFLDEIGEMPLGMQAKLLRVLQDGRFERVGGTDPIHTDCRVIAATNVVLAEAVAAGRFREDLFYRLNVVSIETPPLRERLEDIPLLVNHFLDKMAEKGLPQKTLSRQALSRLMSYDWPGNVRELLNVLRRAALFAEREEIDAALMRRMLAASIFSHAASPVASELEGKPSTVPTSLAQVERAHIERVLAQMEGNVTRAATALGIDRRTLQRKLKSFGLASED
jgi:two-component system, NtrC family, response regulator AtoC